MSEPIGLSTSWNGPGANPARLIEEARALGFRRLEAYAHFSQEALQALAAEAKKTGRRDRQHALALPSATRYWRFPADAWRLAGVHEFL